MQDTANKFCSILFDVLSQQGVKNVVCSPGSRNTPLLIAAAARNTLKKHFCVDERSAAFLALGLATVGKTPVAMICTSGTALLNYAPAMAEAYYQGIPLIVISADRPQQWIDQDDSQTLRQDGALDNFVKKSYSIPSIGAEEEEMRWYANRIANDAIVEATSRKPGPVHINIQLADPLGEKSTHSSDSQRLFQSIEADALGNKELIKNLAQKAAASKIMFVAGFGLPDAVLQKGVAEFSRFPNVTVMAETISNLHLDNDCYSVDATLTAFDTETLDRYAPDIVISIGGALVSRKLKEFLRRHAGKCEHWSVGYSNYTSDPFMTLTLKIESSVSRFLKNLNAALRKCEIPADKASYTADWKYLRASAAKAKAHYIKKCEWSELKAFDYLLKNVPANFNLFLSNGTAIRYAQIISYKLPHASYCNRGVSGIDGSISTAIGGALEYKGKTMIITGDLSMAYDIGSLSLHNIPDNFKIIVIDNQGGGIFRFIPSTSSLEERETYHCQAPNLPLPQLAEGYGWKYFECDDEKQLQKLFPKFLAEKDKAILKIKCNGVSSAEILKGYMAVKAHI